ncbi:lantibiotic dehydratase [Taibaiella soli]|nr:lantibiotic dehydratase [Taibaiella soli]
MTEKIIFRTPLHPFTKAYETTESLKSSFNSGLYLSSKALYGEYLRIDSLPKVQQQKLRQSIAKYQLRACARATPYASFAGLSLAEVQAGDTSLVLASEENHFTALRMDMNLVSHIIGALQSLPEILVQLSFTVNNSLYAVAGGYRYAEYNLQRSTRKYQLINLNATPYLDAIIQAAATPQSFQSLTWILQELTGVDETDAREYLQQLIASQVLISALEPEITGEDPFSRLLFKLENINGVEGLLAKLKQLQLLFQVRSVDVTHLENINAAVADLGLNLSGLDDIVQADVFLSTRSAQFSKELYDAIVQQVEALSPMANLGKHPELEDFKTQFLSRYEDQLIPLAIALDADLGIGYSAVKDELSAGTPLIDELPVSRPAGAQTVELNLLTAFSLRKYEDWQKNGAAAIEITDEDLKLFTDSNKHIRIAQSRAILGSLYKKEDQLNGQHFMLDLVTAAGPSAGNLLGRFAYADSEICDFTRSLLLAEEQQDPDVIFAEIAHLPQARIGNIILRPLLRAFEIPYVGLSSASEENQIKLGDLWVKVEGGEIVLWSKKNNKRVIPRLTTAHNYNFQSLPVYKFLCDLQMQGFAFPAAWSWGLLDSKKYLPRVMYKNIILRKARWIADSADLKNLPGDPVVLTATVLQWQKEQNIPDKVVFAEGDNELLIDFREPLGRELFLHYLAKYKRIKLGEFLFTEENAVVHDEQGAPYVNEIIIPLSRPSAANYKTNIRQDKVSVKRTFLPGSEWVYYKIYSGTKTAELLLKEYILPFVEEGVENNWFEQFFFIRYRDESAHIRLRFLVVDATKRQALQEALFNIVAPLQDEGLIQKIVCDTYVRELERYGGDYIVQAEQLFHNDSLCVLRFLALLDGEDAERYRMLFGLRGIDMFLNDFGLSVFEKQQLLSNMQKAFYEEHGGHASLQKVLNEKYRQHQKDIFAHMNNELDVFNQVDDAVAVFQMRSEMNAPIIETLIGNVVKKQWLSWLPSYIHMYMNRLFVAQQRKYELAVYHFLEKYYSSQLAIQKSKSQIAAATV